jgi:predicted amidohydrolase
MVPPAGFRLATAQIEISADVRRNGSAMRRFMTKAARGGARLVHFPEGAVSGYVKSQIKSWDAVDWNALREELEQIAETAGKLGIWTVFGANHRLTPPNRPHNSLYILSDEGKLIGRYDKRYCSNSEINDWYAPGSEPVVFTIDGFRFGCAICIEVHFAELFLEYERLDVDCVLLSVYSKDPVFGITAQAHAAINNYWLSLSSPTQCSRGLASGLVAPNGQFVARCRAGRSGLAIQDLDRSAPELDIALNKARPWRCTARVGEIYEARRVEDGRSANRGEF